MGSEEAIVKPLFALVFGAPIFLNPVFVGDAWSEAKPADLATVSPAAEEESARVRAGAFVLEEPAPEPPPAAEWVRLHASWYGPGFYGNHTACGQLFTPSTGASPTGPSPVARLST